MKDPGDSGKPHSYSEALRQMTLRYERLVHALSILRQLDSLDNPERDVDEIAHGILEAIALGLAAENCSLMLADENNEYLELCAGCGPLDGEVFGRKRLAWSGYRFRFGEGIVGKVAESREPAIVHDVRLEPDFLDLGNNAVTLRSLLSFPLIVDGRVLGVLNLSHSEPCFFKDDSAHVLELVAERAARIFANHVLHRRVTEAEAQSRLVAESASDVILVLDEAGCVRYANPAVAEVTGKASIGFLQEGLNWMDCILHEDQARFHEHCASVLHDTIPGNIDYRCLDAFGNIHHLEQRTSPMPGAEGSPGVLVCVARDVTSRKQTEAELDRYRNHLEELVAERSAELMNLNNDLEREVSQHRKAIQALKENEGKYRALFESAAEGILLIDNVIVDCNDAFLRMLGYSREQAIGHALAGFSPELQSDGADSATRMQEHLAKALRGGSRSFRWQLNRLDGVPVEAEICLNGLVMGGRRMVQAMVRDITERLQSERQLRRLAAVIEQVSEIIFITDTRGVIEYVNPAFERLTGYSREEAIGQTPRLLKSGCHDEMFYQRLWEHIQRGEIWTGRIVNRRKDGGLMEEECTISPVRTPLGEIVNYVAVKRDVTAEVEMETRLRQAQKMEAVGQLAGGVAHDFNNLLQGIRGYAHMAMEELNPQDKPYHSIDEIIRTAERAAQLTRHLLTFSRQQPIESRDIDLNKTIGDMMDMLHRLISAPIELVFTPGDALKTIHADPDQVGLATVNLCLNARDAMASGGRITIATRYERLEPSNPLLPPDSMPGEYVLCAVSDTGDGIPDAIRDRIFDPFFTTKDIGKGTGLGLSMVYGVVKRHGGFIALDTRKGSGSTFTMAFPAVDRPVEKSLSGEQEDIPSGFETILVAEDEEVVRKVVVLLLEKAGYHVLLAKDGEEAIRLFDASSDLIDLALLDVAMPRVTGGAVCEHIRKTKPGLPVVFCSGHSAGILNTNLRDSTNTFMLQKPYSPADLLRGIRKALDLYANTANTH